MEIHQEKRGAELRRAKLGGGIKGQLSVSGKLDEWGKAGDTAEEGGDGKLQGITRGS